jgi:hypothetical protein
MDKAWKWATVTLFAWCVAMTALVLDHHTGPLPQEPATHPPSGATYPQVPNSGDAGYALISLGVNLGYQNQPINAAGAGTGIGIYGDGSDGAVVADGAATVTCLGAPSSNVYTQTRDCYFQNLTVNVGVTVKAAGFREFSNGTATINGHISVDGAAAVAGGSFPGAGGGWDIQGATALGSLGGGRGGANGGASLSTVLNSMGGAGGAGGSGGPYGVTRPLAVLGSPHEMLAAVRGSLIGNGGGSAGTNAPVLATLVGGNGGAGGANGTTNGDGGGGGGVAVCAFFNLAGTGSITANGGAGACGNAGSGLCLPSASSTLNGGGGGGGLVAIITRTNSGGVTVSATGGAGAGGTSTAGASGTVLQFTE